MWSISSGRTWSTSMSWAMLSSRATLRFPSCCRSCLLSSVSLCSAATWRRPNFSVGYFSRVASRIARSGKGSSRTPAASASTNALLLKPPPKIVAYRKTVPPKRYASIACRSASSQRPRVTAQPRTSSHSWWLTYRRPYLSRDAVGYSSKNRSRRSSTGESCTVSASIAATIASRRLPAMRSTVSGRTSPPPRPRPARREIKRSARSIVEKGVTVPGANAASRGVDDALQARLGIVPERLDGGEVDVGVADRDAAAVEPGE